jgi:hypothetical protein|tara:strand:- start:23319 stop:23825 length:507 start_codon:yes stop_codon:yes gene_type:complete
MSFCKDSEFNGRVELMKSEDLTQYKLFNEPKQTKNDFNKMAIKNIHTENPLSEMYFCQSNVDILQDGIRYLVYQKTNNKHVIGKQSEHDLMIIMRSIYLQYAQNLPYNLVEQVKILNSKVLDYAVPTILREINQFVNYKNDIGKLPIPLERSKNVSSAGSKVLFSKEF